MAKPRDLRDPAFPHGEPRGYQYGCRANAPCPASPTCAEEHARDARDRYRRRAYGRTVDTDMVDSARALAALDALRATHTFRAIEEMTGFHQRQVFRLVTERPARVLRSTERTLTRALVEGVEPEPARVPIERFWQRVHSLAALGYPPVWVAGQIGYPPGQRFSIPKAQRWVSSDLWARLDAVYERIGDRPADPARDGIRPASVTRVLALAKRNGWRAPIHFDDDGNLIPEARRRDEGARVADPGARERDARDRIEGLRTIVNRRLPSSEAAARLGLNARTLERAKEDVGLKTYWDRWYEETRPRPECEHLVPLIRDAGHRLDLMEADPTDLWDDLVAACRAANAATVAAVAA